LKILTHGRKVAGAVKVLVKSENFSIEAVRGLHEELFVSTLIHGCENMVWHEYEKSRVRAVEMDHLRSACGIQRKIE